MKALTHTEVFDICRPIVIGDANRLRMAGDLFGSTLRIRTVSSPGEAQAAPGFVDCIDLMLIPAEIPWGQVSTACGDAAYQYIARAVDYAITGEIDAICTAPFNKEALQAAGHLYPGHTEILARLTGTAEVSMMLSTTRMKVIHVTGHLGLLDAVERINPGLVERTIRRAWQVVNDSGVANPRIGVCGINPHAGENGLFGRGEEETKIEPAVKTCRALGWNVEGPLPADTLFYRAARGDFDIVVAMYHDQGHGPVKVLGIENGVNITVGLPVIRTSVDHGTAFDIAGTGKADEKSLLLALRQAAEFTRKK
jgi:4-hydroxythreonine-4-phosphate dehydrogenase